MDNTSPLVNLRIDCPPSSIMKDAAESVLVAHALMTIDGPDTYEIACDELMRLMGLAKRLDAEEATIIKPINQAHAAAKEHFRAPREFLEQAIAILKNGMLYYRREEERKRIEQQKVLDEAVAKERQRLSEEAKALRTQGSEEAAIEAQALEDTAMLVIAPSVERSVPKVKGLSARKRWTYEITDIEKIPREYWVLDEKKIGGVVRSLQSAANIPGIRVFSDETLASRSK